MNALAAPHLLSVEDYLEGERGGDIRHEYLGGIAYAMAGESRRHNRLAGKIYAGLLAALAGGKSEAYFEDVKLRITLNERDVFYYPDVLVTCDSRDDEEYFVRFPRLIVEVLSDSTENTDRREKFWNYTTIPTLEEYVLVAQDRFEVTIFRRAQKWAPEIQSGPTAEIHLHSINLRLPLRDIYEGIAL